MLSTTPVIIIGADPGDETLIRGQLEGAVTVLAFEPAADNAVSRVREAGNCVAVLCLDRDPDAMLSLARKLSRSSGCELVMASRDRDSETILTAMRAGARDVAWLDEAEQDVRRAVLNLGRIAGKPEENRGTILALFSAKGGSGATALATNLGGAILANRADARVVIVDLDFHTGDVLVFLDLAAGCGFSEIVRNMHRLDEELLHKSLAAHVSGLRVLAQSDQAEPEEDVDGQGVASVLSFLARHYDYVILDGLRDFRETALVALDVADRIVLTMTPDIPALKNASRCLGLFKKLGYGAQKVKLVLNRHQKRGDLDLDAAADALGRSIDGTVANDFPTVVGSINQGAILTATAPRSRVSRDVHALLPMLGIRASDENHQRSAGIFGRLLG